jgi:alpha-1,2-rhamnosyltransferase
LNHPEFGKRLHWICDATDGDLAFAYKRAHCLLQTSVIEGFGLPIIEAASFGLPIIASDIPIFREVAQDRVIYFPVCDSASLASEIAVVVSKRPIQDAIPVNSWEQFLLQLTQTLASLVSEREAKIADDRDPRESMPV